MKTIPFLLLSAFAVAAGMFWGERSARKNPPLIRLTNEFGTRIEIRYSAENKCWGASLRSTNGLFMWERLDEK